MSVVGSRLEPVIEYQEGPQVVKFARNRFAGFQTFQRTSLSAFCRRKRNYEAINSRIASVLADCAQIR